MTYYKANTTVDSLTAALNVISTPSQQSSKVVDTALAINYMANGGGGNYSNDVPFPTQQIGDDINDFVIEATTSIIVPSAGQWTFGVNSDDGFQLVLSRNGINYTSQFASGRAAANTLTTFNLPSAGQYSARLVMFERAGGASVELFAAQGAHATFNASAFDLIGDTVNGGLAAQRSVPSGPNAPHRTNIASAMSGVNASAYLRIPFTVADVGAIESLKLKMRYDTTALLHT